MVYRIWNYYSKLTYLNGRKLSIIATGKRSLCSHNSNGDNPSNTDNPKSTEKKVEVKVVDKTESDDKKQRAHDKLLSLLSDIKISNTFSEEANPQSLKLAKPTQRINKPKKIKEETNAEDDSTLKGQLKLAVKDIVTNIPIAEKAKEIETELVKSITLVTSEESSESESSSSESESSSSESESSSSEEESNLQIEEEVQENIKSAVKAVASTVVKDEEEEVQSELTKKLIALAFQKESASIAVEQEKVMDLFQSMKIETNATAQPELKVKAVKHQTSPRQKQTHADSVTTSHLSRFQSLPVYDLFNSNPLNIFDETTEIKESSKLHLWQNLREKELKLSVQFAPTNPFEEMIQLTEEGKHWKFPIDNEIDMGEEEAVGFHEHVFLDYLLEGFPKKGPVHRFMELVITGLSKNPYISVERKKENVEWFRNYFEEKKAYLEDYQ